MSWFNRLWCPKTGSPVIRVERRMEGVPHRIAEFLDIQGHDGNLDSDQEELMLQTYLSDEIILDEFRRQTAAIFSDPNTDWTSILAHFKVYDAQDTADAHRYAKLAVWDYAFPDKRVPLDR